MSAVVDSKELEVIDATGNNFAEMQKNAFALKKEFERLKTLFEAKKADSEQKENFDESVLLYEEATKAFSGYLRYAYKFCQQIKQMKSVKPRVEIQQALLKAYPIYGFEDIIKAANMQANTGNSFKAQKNLQKAVEWHLSALRRYSHVLKQPGYTEEQRDSMLEKMLEILELYEGSTLQQKWIRNLQFKINTSFRLAIASVFVGCFLFVAFPIAAGVIYYPMAPIAVIIMPIIGSLLFVSFIIMCLSLCVLNSQIKKEIKNDRLLISEASLKPKQGENPTNKSKLEVTSSYALDRKIEPVRVLFGSGGDHEQKIELASRSTIPNPTKTDSAENL